MWIDVKGVCHTVALPDPAELMSDEFRHGLDRLISERGEEISDLVSTEEERFYREHAAGPVSGPEESGFEGLTPPLGLLRGSVTTVEELSARIGAVEHRWRLDVLVALDEYFP